MWTPLENVFKVNVDVAINNKDQRTSLGAVIRDSKGIVIAAGAKQAHFRGNVSLAKAEAIQWGIQVVRTTKLTSLILESDGLEVVQLANNTKGSRIEFFLDNFGHPKSVKEFPRSYSPLCPKTM